MSAPAPIDGAGWSPAKVVQMNGDQVARELPAEGQIVTASWNRAVAVPYLVYMPEVDRLLMLVSCDYPTRPMVMVSADHGRTWSAPRPVLPGAEKDGRHLLGVALTYLGQGTLVYHVETAGTAGLWFSHDYGETWGEPTPIPPASNGLPVYQWDPYLVDRHPLTGAVTRLVQTGYNGGVNDTVNMERTLAAAAKRFVFPAEWSWRPDPQDRGIAEGWQKLPSFDDWPRRLRLDKPWTEQGEPPCLAWYGTRFQMPETGGVPLLIFCGAIDGTCDVFLDGQKIGEQKGAPETMWDQPFYIALDAGLAPGSHTMAIRVHKDRCAAGIHKPIWIFDASLRQHVVLAASGRVLPLPTTGYQTKYAFLRFSTDRGLTWSADIRPPSWNEVGGDEVALCRAGNGTLVAAVRTAATGERQATEAYKRLGGIDHFEGLGASLSKDDGYTWTKVTVLYDHGRHHPCMALLPNGDLVMTHVVRLGYPRDPDDFPQFGIEAVVSHDHGESWDLPHRYILAKWSGNRKGGNEWWAMSQATSTVLLPDGSLLTAYGTSYRSQPLDSAAGSGSLISPRDVGLVRWQPAPA
jgi:hypothetical protein